MICPSCSNDSEMIYSSLSNSFVCLAGECGLELPVERSEAEAILCTEVELVCV